MINRIVELQSQTGKESNLTAVRTKNGFHLIATPFRLDIFYKEYPGTMVHKDNPTILYIK
jgi:hypothetical protein